MLRKIELADLLLVALTVCLATVIVSFSRPTRSPEANPAEAPTAEPTGVPPPREAPPPENAARIRRTQPLSPEDAARLFGTGTPVGEVGPPPLSRQPVPPRKGSPPGALTADSPNRLPNGDGKEERGTAVQDGKIRYLGRAKTDAGAPRFLFKDTISGRVFLLAANGMDGAVRLEEVCADFFVLAKGAVRYQISRR